MLVRVVPSSAFSILSYLSCHPLSNIANKMNISKDLNFSLSEDFLITFPMVAIQSVIFYLG